jgi:ankyrin repeat protein
MRILVLTLILSFLSHSAFGAEEEMKELIQQHNLIQELHRKEQAEIQSLQVDETLRHMDETLRHMEEDRVYLSGRLESILSHGAFGADEGASDDCTLSPFLSAVSEGDIPLVNQFLQDGEDIDQQDCDGATPLIIAAVVRQQAMCQYLILRGADTGIRTHDGWNIGMILCHLRHGS